MAITMRAARLALILLCALAVRSSAQPVPAVATDTTGPRVLIATDLGDIEIAIDSVHAPITAANFLRYVDGGYYEGGRFFRVVRSDNQPTDSIRIAVVQAAASDRARAAFAPIPLESTAVTGLRHVDGTISMARAGPETATSSFFLCIGEQPSLDAGGMRNPDGLGFAAFGRVVRGMEVVRRIHTGAADGQNLTTPVRILTVRRI